MSEKDTGDEASKSQEPDEEEPSDNDNGNEEFFDADEYENNNHHHHNDTQNNVNTQHNDSNNDPSLPINKSLHSDKDSQGTSNHSSINQTNVPVSSTNNSNTVEANSKNNDPPNASTKSDNHNQTSSSIEVNPISTQNDNQNRVDPSKSQSKNLVNKNLDSPNNDNHSNHQNNTNNNNNNSNSNSNSHNNNIESNNNDHKNNDNIHDNNNSNKNNNNHNINNTSNNNNIPNNNNNNDSNNPIVNDSILNDSVDIDPQEVELQKFQVRNLDTGESAHINDVTSVFPEVAAAITMTLSNLEKTLSKNNNNNNNQTNALAHVEEESNGSVDEKKKTLGFHSLIDKMKDLFHKNKENEHENQNIVKVKYKKKDKLELSETKLIQSIGGHTGPIWTIALSHDGDLIATGGQDSIVRIWAVMGSAFAKELQDKQTQKHNSTNQTESNNANEANEPHSPDNTPVYVDIPSNMGGRRLVWPVPYRTYAGHKQDVVDLAWSRANFLLSASIDKTARLWHVTRPKCLCVFAHADFVTAVAFHPIEDRFFVSGSFDKKFRIWNIPEHRVVEWVQTSNIITSAAFSPNGQMVVAGLYAGQCVFYQSEGLKYFTQIECRNRHGRNSKGKKVTGVVFSNDGKQLLVTTNDSRIRIFDMGDFSNIAKFKGLQNDELQIRAHFNEDCSSIICGSEDNQVYVWPTGDKGKNESYEYFRGSSTTTTCAQFLPKKTFLLGQADTSEFSNAFSALAAKHLMVVATYNGELKFFENSGAPKHV